MGKDVMVMVESTKYRRLGSSEGWLIENGWVAEVSLDLHFRWKRWVPILQMQMESVSKRGHNNTYFGRLYLVQWEWVASSLSSSGWKDSITSLVWSLKTRWLRLISYFVILHQGHMSSCEKEVASAMVDGPFQGVYILLIPVSYQQTAQNLHLTFLPACKSTSITHDN